MKLNLKMRYGDIHSNDYIDIDLYIKGRSVSIRKTIKQLAGEL